jgi:hypothetical protein
MREAGRHSLSTWKRVAWTIGGLMFLGIVIFFTDGVPALIRHWFEPRP